jgi:CubicO group peptidase (beta-lactamase class C family)
MESEPFLEHDADDADLGAGRPTWPLFLLGLLLIASSAFLFTRLRDATTASRTATEPDTLAQPLPGRSPGSGDSAADRAGNAGGISPELHPRPYWPTESWLTSAPEEQGMDSQLLSQMIEAINERAFAIDCVLVVRNGYIVLEEYWNVYTAETKHELQSVTKSFTSVLIGIAFQQGLLESVEQRMVDLFPNHTIANLDPRKLRITLEHLLTMSDGMDWHEHDYPYNDSRNTLGQMWVSPDAVQHVLGRPMAREPGESWAYNSGTSILLGGIIEQVSGRDVRSFAREHLFDPLGIGEIEWSMTTGNHYHTDGGLYMTPRDMARLGYLMLNEGTWDGVEIVSSDWVSRSTTTHYLTEGGDGYGYQWWTWPGRGVYAARGHYEQNIFVVPEERLVVVFTANIADQDLYPAGTLLQMYVLPACRD